MSAQKTTETSDKLKGSVKEAIGKLVGDPEVEAEGKSQQTKSQQTKSRPALSEQTFESQQKLPKSDVKPKAMPKS